MVGYIDLNEASAEELTQADIERMSEKRAQDLIEHRPFFSWEEVKKRVPGFGDGMVQHLKDAGVTI